MPKIPRDISGRDLCKLLSRYGYAVDRQTGSHIRLSSNHMKYRHSLTIPDHDPVKIGTLNHIILDVSVYLKKDKNEIVDLLFG